MCLFVCAVDHGVIEEEPVDEKYREQVCEEQYRKPEPENEYREQELPEGFEDYKFNLILRCIFCPSFINTTNWSVLQNCICFYY